MSKIRQCGLLLVYLWTLTSVRAGSQRLVNIPLAPPHVIRNPSVGLANVSVCRLNRQCESPFQTFNLVLRRNFFHSDAEMQSYCGAPEGYVAAIRTGKVSTMEILHQANETWETPFAELRHLPSHHHCMVAMKNAGAIAAALESGKFPSARDEQQLHSKPKSRHSSLIIPLLHAHDILFGGQFVPFTKEGRVYVPLSTGEAYGGVSQGAYPSVTGGKVPLLYDPQNVESVASQLSLEQIPESRSLHSTATDCCNKPSQNYMDQREKEQLQWLDKDTMSLTKSVTYFNHDVLVAHGGGWGDYQV